VRTALAYLVSLACHGAVLAPLGFLPSMIDTPPAYTISSGIQAIELQASLAVAAQSGGEDIQIVTEPVRPVEQIPVETTTAPLLGKEDPTLPEIVPPKWHVAADQSPRPATVATKEQLGQFGSTDADVAPCKLPANPDPPYPREVQAQRIGGVVVLQVLIRADGSVEKVSLYESSGIPALDESALSTVRDRWRFQPGTSRGVAVPCECILPIRFKPSDR
jgi:TonB family protein